MDGEPEQRISNGLVVIDCSWKKGTSIFSKSFRGRNKRLPILQAGNPINYGKLFTLSSAEALAACLFIIGFRDDAELILSKFRYILYSIPCFRAFSMNHSLGRNYSVWIEKYKLLAEARQKHLDSLSLELEEVCPAASCGI